MKPLSEFYDRQTGDGVFEPWCEFEPKPGHERYDAMLQTFGDVLVSREMGSYSGDTVALIRDGDRYGYLTFGWGSCSGCDAYEACRTWDDLTKLQQELHSQIKWGDAYETLTFLQEHDWEGDWLRFHEPDLGLFRHDAESRLRSDIQGRPE